MNESGPDSEKKIVSLEQTLTKDLVVESLRNFPNDPTLLIAYVEQRQKLIQASYVSREDTEKRTLAFNQKQWMHIMTQQT